MNEITISNIRENPSSYLGGPVIIKGFLMAKTSVQYLSEERWGNIEDGIPIRHVNILEYLHATLPAFIGGEYVYSDQSLFQGTLQFEDTDSKKIILGSLESCKIWREKIGSDEMETFLIDFHLPPPSREEDVEF